MRTEQSKTIYLKDYQVPDYLIDETHLTFELFEDHSLVHAQLVMRRNPEAGAGLPKLVLDGQQLELLELKLDDRELDGGDYSLTDSHLTLQPTQERFVVDSSVRIHPESNTALEGLYKSSGMFCTQCEAEGFRKITFYLDRPDVMSKFTTTVSAEQHAYPVLLSNGNPIASGSEETASGKSVRHWATWEDPFKKPAYLFALVAGDLWCVEDSFTTMSKREVALRIYVEPENIDKVQHAMDSLKRSMKWDEEVYGREYDLDIFMIVAVNDFNMGAMENKGLNIFNSSCVLAKAETATDAAHQRVEAVVAHEYFHNWSGNRVTCRDWFQLSLKEGFTVFRDSEFSADTHSRTVKRIEDVAYLRTHQFAEDAGPMAHPVRPDAYMEISNFYTLTIYEKGAEVLRMIHTLLGPELFRKGSDLYFERHDGQAVTCDDFVKAMEDASGIDLTQFKRWYTQAGTPRLEVSEAYDAAAQTYSLTFRQSCPATPGQSEKLPFVIPVALG
ncbi:MAG TPA: aminopeptidase N, partial [Pseudomonas sp.]|nr:aminopeptidase N [Pseudomonas sp.]